MEATARRVRVGAELRRLRVSAGMSGEQVARALGWSQSKVSRVEGGLHSVATTDVAGLLAVYGAGDDVRAELLAATAADNGEGAWIVRTCAAGGSSAPDAAPGFGTARLRHHQPVQLPGLLQTREYARAIARATGGGDPDVRADAWMRRQEVLSAADGPRYEVVLDARALLPAVAPVEVVRQQILSLAVRAHRLPRLDLRVIPLGRPLPTVSTTGFLMYDFRAPESRPVVRVDCPAGAAYFAAPDDIERYGSLFSALQGAALSPVDSVRYLRSLATDIERHWQEPAAAGAGG